MSESSKATKPFEVKNVAIGSLVPYWRNPRDNSEAIQKVKESIETYGYQQPIMVDKKNVIIAGHTRYRALMELGYENVDVIVANLTPKKAKEYRIIDNKTSEYASWTNELALELKEFESFKLVESFFPDFQLDLGFAEGLGVSEITQEKIDAISETMNERFSDEQDSRTAGKVDLTCPHCYKEFSLQRSEFDRDEMWS
jgi:ParB-like chromosome segregation protein Spo0J